MGYKVKLDVFEGPFDLLVYLIEQAEMSIYDIRVSEITNQYVEYIEAMKRMDVVLGAEFMVLAATLIEIKSRMLIPREKAQEETLPLQDPRSELVERLLEYKRFKLAAASLEEKEKENLRIFTKPREDLMPYTKEPDEVLNLDLDQFVRTFRNFLEKKRKLEEIHRQYERVERQRMTVEGRIEQIKNLFLRKRKYRFRELLEGETSRYNLVLTFMSMLEMMKDKAVRVKQFTTFGEITITLAEDEQHVRKRRGA